MMICTGKKMLGIQNKGNMVRIFQEMMTKKHSESESVPSFFEI